MSLRTASIANDAVPVVTASYGAAALRAKDSLVIAEHRELFADLEAAAQTLSAS